MTEPSTSTQNFNENDNIDLLDVLVIISQRIKLIFFLTVLGAAIGWLWAQMAPVIYSSTSSLNVEAWKAEENAPQFKTEIIASLVNTNQKFHELLQDESWGAHAAITASTNPKDRLLIVTTTAATPEKAQSLNQHALETVYELTKAKGEKAEQINTIIQNERVRIGQINQAIGGLKTKKTPEEIKSAITSNLLSNQADREINIIKMQDYLKGINATHIIQTPSLPEKPSDKKARMKIATCTFSGLFISLFFVFAKYIITMQLSDEKTKNKLRTVAKNLGI